MKEIVFRLGFCEMLFFIDSTDDIFILDIYEAYRYSRVLEGFLDPKSDI